MTARKLVSSYRDWAAKGQPLVLASVYETEGSTYSKAGAQMLIADNGDFQGMLSGGCLEGDLGERARSVLQTGVPASVAYDLGRTDEELWGLGVGCAGLMRVFLQPLAAENAYQPFAAMAEALAGDEPGAAATVIESGAADLAPGTCLVRVGDSIEFCDIPDASGESVRAQVAEVMARNRSGLCHLEVNGERIALLVSILRPPPRVLVLGAGLDAEPVVRFVDELGWRATVQDHRPVYIENGDFSLAEQVLCVAAAELADSVDLDRFDAAIIMSHHLASDREYLRALAGRDVASIGLLGPRDRRARLLEDLGSAAGDLEPRLHGPAGLDIGATGPPSIAVSIVAQIHRDLFADGDRSD